MKKEFYEPPGGRALTFDVVEDALIEVMATPPGRAYIEAWCELERIVAYDYCIRLQVSRQPGSKVVARPLPWFIQVACTMTAADLAEEAEEDHALVVVDDGDAEEDSSWPR